jgi:hypothetical protein
VRWGVGDQNAAIYSTEEDQGTPISCYSHRSGFFEFVLFFSFSLRRRISFTAAAGTDHLVGARESAASDDDPSPSALESSPKMEWFLCELLLNEEQTTAGPGYCLPP